MDNGEWLPCRVVPFRGEFDWKTNPGLVALPALVGHGHRMWPLDLYEHPYRRQLSYLAPAFSGRATGVRSLPALPKRKAYALDPNGGSFITSVGLRQRTVSIRDVRGEHQISVEGIAYWPKFSAGRQETLLPYPKGRHSLRFSALANCGWPTLSLGHSEALPAWLRRHLL